MLIQGYSDFSISRTAARNDRVCDRHWGAYCRLDGDIREVFPYINGTVKGARYQHRPLHVRFEHREALCTLYTDEVMAYPFSGNDHALEFVEDLVVYINDVYERRNELTPSYRLYQNPPSIVEIVKTLPRSNCRECGYPSCMAFAAALRKGESIPSQCPGFVDPIAVYAVYPVIGQDNTVQSTLSIETDVGDSQTAFQIPAKKVSPKKESATQIAKNSNESLYDQYGIRIQYDLTPREIQVLRLVADGASNPEISAMLHISPHTVKSHVIHIFNKLNVNDRTQAAVWAARNRLI